MYTNFGPTSIMRQIAQFLNFWRGESFLGSLQEEAKRRWGFGQ